MNRRRVQFWWHLTLTSDLWKWRVQNCQNIATLGAIFMILIDKEVAYLVAALFCRA